MIYLFADTHFNHAGILHHTTRPWRDAAQMNAGLIELWNGRVEKEGDDVWFLGDFGFNAPTKPGSRDLAEIWWSLRGRKHLVVGNHDVKNSQVLRLPWETVTSLHDLKYEGSRMILCHYPLASWNGMHRGTLHAHGHCHGTLRDQVPRRYDVGFDALGWNGPIPWFELIQKSDEEIFSPVDAHGCACGKKGCQGHGI